MVVVVEVVVTEVGVLMDDIVIVAVVVKVGVVVVVEVVVVIVVICSGMLSAGLSCLMGSSMRGGWMLVSGEAEMFSFLIAPMLGLLMMILLFFLSVLPVRMLGLLLFMVLYSMRAVGGD